MSPRGEYFTALVTASPMLIGVMFVSMLLCASVFIGAALLRHKSAHDAAAALPFQDHEVDGAQQMVEPSQQS